MSDSEKLTEFIRQIDMVISHFESVAETANKYAKAHKDTAMGHFQDGRADIAEEAVNWLKEAKKSLVTV